MTDPGDLDSDPTTPVGSEFGVTREQVKGLLPNAMLDDEAGASDLANTVISSEQVDQWIAWVSADVTSELAGFERLTDETQIAYVNGAAASVVAVGAAYWWEAARRQETSDTSYAKDLQERYQRMLDALSARVAGWVVNLPELPVPGTVSSIVSSFPTPVFTDGTRW